MDDIQLARIGLAACLGNFDGEGTFNTFKPWEELDTESMECLATFAAAVRGAIEEEATKSQAKRFVWAVERVHSKMTINSNEDAVAWYIVKHWLKENCP